MKALRPIATTIAKENSIYTSGQSVKHRSGSMPDYNAIRKDIYERFHDAIEKLYVSELKDSIADKQAEIEGLRIIIKDLEKRLEHAEWLVDKYRQDE